MTEIELQTMCCNYMRLQYRDVIFSTNYLSGFTFQKRTFAKKMKAAGSLEKGYPDMFVAAVRGGFSGMFIEFKAPGTRIFKKDGTTPSTEHIATQLCVLEKLRQEGYFAVMCNSFDDFRVLVDNYMAGGKKNADFKN